MTRKEEIERAAKEYSTHCIDANELNLYRKYEEKIDFIIPKYNAFLAGVKFADEHPKSPWISVEDSLPCNHDDLICFGYTVMVLVRTENGNIYFNYMVRFGNSSIWDWATPASITHWMPIPKLNV